MFVEADPFLAARNRAAADDDSDRMSSGSRQDDPDKEMDGHDDYEDDEDSVFYSGEDGVDNTGGVGDDDKFIDSTLSDMQKNINEGNALLFPPGTAPTATDDKDAIMGDPGQQKKRSASGIAKD